MDLYHRYKDQVWKLTNARQRHEPGKAHRGLTDEEIAKRLKLTVAEVTEIRCIAEIEMSSLGKYLDAEDTKEKRYKRAPGKIKTQPDSVYPEIYRKAEPYLDTRQNDVHVSLSYDFARRLLAHYPNADEAIVLPAIILHDVGWKMVPEEKQLKAFGPKAKDKKTKRIHEKEGVRIAEEILARLNYDEDKKRVILSIIDGHDTRLEALSLNDQLVKDADKLWRFTPAGVDIDHTRFGIARDRYIKWLETVMVDWFFTPEAREMAHAALAEAKCNSGRKEN